MTLSADEVSRLALPCVDETIEVIGVLPVEFHTHLTELLELHRSGRNWQTAQVAFYKALTESIGVPQLERSYADPQLLVCKNETGKLQIGVRENPDAEVVRPTPAGPRKNEQVVELPRGERVCVQR